MLYNVIPVACVHAWPRGLRLLGSSPKEEMRRVGLNLPCSAIVRTQEQKNDIAQRNYGKSYDELESNEKVRA